MLQEQRGRTSKGSLYTLPVRRRTDYVMARICSPYYTALIPPDSAQEKTHIQRSFRLFECRNCESIARGIHSHMSLSSWFLGGRSAPYRQRIWIFRFRHFWRSNGESWTAIRIRWSVDQRAHKIMSLRVVQFWNFRRPRLDAATALSSPLCYISTCLDEQGRIPHMSTHTTKYKEAERTTTSKVFSSIFPFRRPRCDSPSAGLRQVFQFRLLWTRKQEAQTHHPSSDVDFPIRHWLRATQHDNVHWFSRFHQVSV